MANYMYYFIAMNQANIAELKNNLSKYIAMVEEGKIVVLCRRNIPVARLVPINKNEKNRTIPGCGAGTVVVNTDLTEPAFDSEDWLMLSQET